MSASSLVTIVIVPFYGALLWVTPAITRPTVQFGVRIPADRAGAPWCHSWVGCRRRRDASTSAASRSRLDRHAHP